MEDLQIRGACIVFHAYENGEKIESWDYFDNVLEGIKTNVVSESTLDLTKYDEVHIRQESYDDTYYGFIDEQELDDDHAFDVEITHVILPNKEVYDLTEIVDENIDNTTFETSSGSSFVEYSKVTADGMEGIEYNEEDDMW